MLYVVVMMQLSVSMEVLENEVEFLNDFVQMFDQHQHHHLYCFVVRRIVMILVQSHFLFQCKV